MGPLQLCAREGVDGGVLFLGVLYGAITANSGMFSQCSSVTKFKPVF